MIPLGPLENATQAGALIAFALRRDRPGANSDYKQHLDRYGTDPGFRQLVEHFAEGLGLNILAITRSGLVLSPEVDSVFATKLADMRNTAMSVNDRLVGGLALLGIAAYGYPNAVDLDDVDAPTVDLKAVDAFIRTAATGFPAAPESAEPGRDQSEEAAAAAAEPEAARQRLVTARTAADLYLDLPDYVSTAQGQYKRGCTFRALEEVFSWLIEQGMARPQTTLGATAYQLTDRFRVLVADEASNSAYTVLSAARLTTTDRDS